MKCELVVLALYYGSGFWPNKLAGEHTTDRQTDRQTDAPMITENSSEQA